MKRLVVASIVVGAALACDQPVQPALRGNIVIAFGPQQRLQPSPAIAAAEAAAHGRRTTDQTGDTLRPRVPPSASGQESGGPDLGVMSQLTSVRVQLSGPSPHDTTVTLSTSGSTQLRLDSLLVGSYVVKVWGMVADTVDSYGQADGVQINGGQSTTLDLTNSSNSFPWAPLRPTLRPMTSPTTAFSLPLRFSQVKTATGYQVQWSKSAAFGTPQSLSVTDTTAILTAADTGRYYVRVKATVSATTNPRWSDTVSALVTASPTGGSSSGSPYSVRTGVSGVDTTLSGLNLIPTQVQDWFSLAACREDTLILETFAARLNPPSPLNTLLRLYQPDAVTLVQANDDISGSTDSKIQQNSLPVDGTYKIQVTEANNTVGNYNLQITLKPGFWNSGTSCVPPGAASVQVTPDTVQLTLVSDQAQLTASAKDALNRPYPAAVFTWTSRNTGVATVNASGKVTGAGNGTTYVLATADGHSDSTLVAVGPATVNVVPDSAALSAVGDTVTLSATARNALGNLLSGVAYTWTSRNSAVVTVNSSGLVTAAGNGTTYVVGTTGGVLDSSKITVAQVYSLSQSVVSLSATSVAAASSVTFKLTARDSRGNRLPGGGLTVTFGLSGGAATGTIGAVVDSGNGAYTANFRGETAGSATVGGTINGSAVTSALPTVTVTPGPAKKLAIQVQPGGAIAGDSIKPAIQVIARDTFDNQVPTVTGAVTMTFGTNPSGGSLFGNITRFFGAGVASFNDLKIDKAGNGYTLTATSGSLTPATTDAFNITGGAPRKLAFTVQPSNTGAGAQITPAIQVAVQDSLGNTATGATYAITLVLSPNAGGSVLSGTVTRNAVSGVATFNDISLDKIATGYRFHAGASGLDTAISNTFDITGGASARLSFSVEPTNATAGASITPAIQVAVLDVGGNPATGATDSITISILNNAGGGTLSGTVGVRAVNGVATFSDLSINKVGNGYTLRAASASLTPDTSASFNISAGTAYRLAFGQQPSATTSGATITPSPTVLIQDQFFNLVTGATNQVTVAIGNNPASGNLSGTAQRNAVSGVATFNDLSIDKAGTGYTLSATATSLQSAASSSFNVVASATVNPDSSTAFANPTTGVVVLRDTATVTVTVKDPGGNPIQAQVVQLSSTGSNNLIIPAANTDVNGVATAKITSRTAETKTLTITVNPSGTPVVLTEKPTVQFVADTLGLSSTLSTASASPDSLVGDGVQQSTITVTARDTLNNLVAGRPVKLLDHCTGCTGSATLTQPGVTNGSGVTTGTVRRAGTSDRDTIWVILKPGQTDSALTQKPAVRFVGDTVSLDVNLSSIAVTYSGGIDTALADGSDPATIQVTVRNKTNNPIQGDSVYLSLSGSGNSITQPVAPTNSSGQTTGSVRSTVAELKTLTVTVYQPNGSGGYNARVLATQPQIPFKAGNPADLAFIVQPSNTAAGFAISPSVQVAVVDANGNTVTDDTRGIVVDTVGAFGGDSLYGTKTVSAVNGVATFSNLSIRRAVNGYSIRARDVGAMLPAATSNTFNITAASPTQLAYQVQPSSVAAGASITPSVEIKVMDQYGNTATTATNAVTVALVSNPGAATLSGTKTRNAVAGIATFNDLSLDKASTGYTLGASAGGLTGTTSNAFNVTAAGAARLRFTAQPTSAGAGATIPSFEVTVQDAFGNTVTSDVDSVDVSIANDPSGGSAILSGTTRRNAVAGVATFNDVSINKSGVGYSLRATRAGLTQDFSSSFNITAGGATQLAFTVQPAVTTAGVAVNPAVRVTARDPYGNTATSFADSVSMALGANPGSGTLFGTLKAVAVSGVATFSNLRVDKSANGYTLVASASGLIDASSNGFNILPAGVKRVAFTQEPSTTGAGSNVSPAILVAVQDTFGNLVPSATNPVSLAILDNPAGGSLFGQTTVSAVSGVATFNAVTVDKRSDGYTLLATSSGLIPDTSAAFTIHAGAPSASASNAVTSPTSGVFADNVQQDTVIVVVRDSFANPAPGHTVALAASGTGNTITQPGSPADTNGTAKGFIVTTVAETKTVTATVDGSVVITQQPTVAFVADTGASATQSLVSASPGTVEANGSSTATVTVTVRDQFSNPIPGKTVTIGLSGTGNTITQPSGPTNGSGVATGTIASTKAETKTVTVTVDGKVLQQQPTVTFAAGPPAQLGFVVEPTDVAAGAAITPAVEVAVQDAQGNTVDTATASVTMSLLGGTSSSSLYGTLTHAAVSGIATFSDLKVDSAGTGYQLHATSGSYALTAGTSSSFAVFPGAVYTIAVSPNPDSIFVLGGTRAFTALGRDSVGNAVPSAVFSWSSNNDPVASVDPSTGVVTGKARGLATITASSGGKFGTASLVVAVRVAELTTASTAVGQIFSSGDLPGRTTAVDATTFNGMSPTDLRAAYDVLVVRLGADPGLNVDWATRLRPYLQLGGGIIWEDDGSNNGAELSPIVTHAALSGALGGIAALATPNLTGGVGNSFNEAYFHFTAWSDSLAHFIVRGDTAVGLYGRFGGGCVVFDGPAEATDGFRAGTAQQSNQYLLLLNEVRFAADCPLNASPGAAQSVRVFPYSVRFSDAGLNATPRATALDNVGTPVPNATITWSSTNDSVATVNPSTGEITSVRNGQVSIQASGSGADYVQVTVDQPAVTQQNAWGTEVASGVLSNSYLLGVWGAASNDVFVTGFGGVIRHYNGTATWDTLNSGTLNDLWRVWGTSHKDVFTVGGSGTILHFDGGSWSPMSNPLSGTGDLIGVWGSSPTDVFAVGYDYGGNGKILHYDGSSWTAMPTPVVSYLYGIWGTSPRNVYAVGQDVILRYDGSAWSIVSNGGGNVLLNVWGSGPSDVWVVGGGNLIYHFDGSSWTTTANPAGYQYAYGIWGTSANEVYAGNSDGSVIKYNGSTWTVMRTPWSNYVLALWGTATGRMTAVGGSPGLVLHGVRGATAASVVVSPSGATADVGLTANFGATAYSASGDVITPSTPFSWAVANSAVASINASTGQASAAGSGQTPVSATMDAATGYANLTVNNPASTAVNLFDSTATPAGSWLWGVWGRSATEAYAMGVSGRLLVYNGSSWSTFSPAPPTASDIRSMWGSSSSDLWATTGGGELLHFDGSSWTTTTTGTGMYGIWGSAPNDIWAVGNGGAIWHYDGTTWSSVASPTPNFLWAVWGVSRDEVYAVGSGGTIIRYTSGSWQTMTSNSAATFYRIWGANSTNVFAVGSGGVVDRWNGGAWTPSTVTTAQLYGVWGSGPNDVYAVGSPINGIGTVLRFNGATWNPLVSRASSYLYGVWGTDAGNVWLSGEAAIVRRGARGASISASQQISFADNLSQTRVHIASNGSTYHTAHGGSVDLGRLGEFTLGGSFIDSVVFAIDFRSLVYRGANSTYYAKDYHNTGVIADRFWIVDPQTGTSLLQWTTLAPNGFTNDQSAPTVTQFGSPEVLEFNAGTIRRLSPTTGALLGTIGGISGSQPTIASDGYYLYTFSPGSPTTVYVYSMTGTPVTTFTVPVSALSYSLSYANGMLWVSSGVNWYGYSLNVTP